MSNVDINVDGSPLTDESGTPAPDPGEELQLAGYLDGLIAAAMVRKASRESVGTWAPDEHPPMDPPPESPAPPGDSFTQTSDWVDAGSPEASRASGGEAPPGGRASMSEELAALFRPTEQPPPLALDDATPSEGATAPDKPGAPTIEPSVFLRRFLRRATRPTEFALSGIDGLDARLAGGFGPGLHLVAGPSSHHKTAFLDSVVWEAVASKRPVIYYCLRGGSLGAWERLVGTLGSILGGPTRPRTTFLGRRPGTADVEALTRLDTTLQRSVLPFVSLVESIPAHPDSLSAFVEDSRSRAREAEERHRKMPLVVLDDLEQLSFLTGSRRLPHVLTRLDEVLLADSTPGLVAADLSSCHADGLEAAPAQTTLELEPVRPVHGEDFGLVDLRLLTNRQTAWTGALPLLLDQQTWLYSEYPITPKPRSVSQ